jgi:hypothetical protein
MNQAESVTIVTAASAETDRRAITDMPRDIISSSSGTRVAAFSSGLLLHCIAVAGIPARCERPRPPADEDRMPFLPNSHPVKQTVQYLAACLLARCPTLVLAQAAASAER